MEAVKTLQYSLCNEALFLREEFYDGQHTLEEYRAKRLAICQKYFTELSKIVRPSNQDTSWLTDFTNETLRQELAVVPSSSQLTKDNYKKLCLIQERHLREFFEEFTKRNFSSLTGKDYIIEMAQEGFSVLYEKDKDLDVEVKRHYRKVV